MKERINYISLSDHSIQHFYQTINITVKLGHNKDINAHFFSNKLSYIQNTLIISIFEHPGKYVNYLSENWITREAYH